MCTFPKFEPAVSEMPRLYLALAELLWPGHTGWNSLFVSRTEASISVVYGSPDMAVHQCFSWSSQADGSVELLLELVSARGAPLAPGWPGLAFAVSPELAT